jgi:hypothetical protein
LAVCGVALAVQPRLRDTEQWAELRAKIRALLRVTPRQRVLSLPRKAGSRFRPLESIKILAARRVRFVVVGEIAARLHGAPLTRGTLDIAVQPERLNSERLARALEAMAGTSRPTKGLPTSLRDLRGRRQLQTRFGIIGCWWPPGETYRRLEGAATELPLAARPVHVASIDDVMERWRGSGDELALLAATREEVDARAFQDARRRRHLR